MTGRDSHPDVSLLDSLWKKLYKERLVAENKKEGEVIKGVHLLLHFVLHNLIAGRLFAYFVMIIICKRFNFLN